MIGFRAARATGLAWSDPRALFGLDPPPPPRPPARDAARAAIAVHARPPGDLFELPRDLVAAELRDIHGREVPGACWRGPALVWFLDEQPGANWAHPCRYLAVDARGVVHDLPHRYPPDRALGEMRPARP